MDAVVVGLGPIGLIHLRTYLRFVERGLLDRVWIYDLKRERCAEARARFPDALELPDATGFPDGLRVASVCVPPDQHFNATAPLFDRGVHALVEKPLAGDVATARALCRCAQRAGVRLFTGHSERFNIAARASLHSVSSPTELEAHRHSTTTPLRHDVDVVHDLMIHDIDLALSLFGPNVQAVQARGERRRGASLDVASAEVLWSGGERARLSVTRVGDQARRTLSLRDGSGTLEIDMLRGSARRGASEYHRRDDLDAIGAQLTAFLVQCGLQTSLESPLAIATGEDGLRALELAAQIVSVVERGISAPAVT